MNYMYKTTVSACDSSIRTYMIYRTTRFQQFSVVKIIKDGFVVTKIIG